MRALWCAVALALAGCSGGGSSHPPGVTECIDPATCGGGAGGTDGTGGASGSTGGSAGAGAGGSAGSGTGGTSGGRSLSGSVTIYADTTFVATNPFTAQGRIGLTGSSRVVGNINAGSWTVDGAETARELWADLHATAPGDAMDTLRVVDGASGGEVVFGSRSAFENVVTGLSSAQSVNPDRAQIVLRFVSSGSQPVSRVKVNLQGATVAYDAGNAYTDAQGAAPLGATQGRGIAVIVNYSATAFPGGPATIPYVELGTNTPGNLDLRAANGAITFRTVVVP